MTEFNKNEFKNNRDITININEENSYGKDFEKCSNEELSHEKSFRYSAKRKRGSKLRKESVKWLLLLAVGVIITNLALQAIWLNMGGKLNIPYILNFSFNFINVESGFLSSMLKVFLPAGFLLTFILLPFKKSLDKLFGNDKLMNKHRDAIRQIEEILEERKG